MFGESEEAEDTYLVTISERIQGTSLPGTGRELRRSFMQPTRTCFFFLGRFPSGWTRAGKGKTRASWVIRDDARLSPPRAQPSS